MRPERTRKKKMRPDPAILAFDTSAAHCAAALLSNGQMTVVVEEMARGQGERLMPLLEEVLASCDLGWDDLDALGVGVGPGNFTGIRISVSAARGLALGLGIPAVGVSMFDTTQRLSNWAQTAVPAPREQAYFMDFDKMSTAAMVALDGLKDGLGAVALSSDHSVADHVACIARIAAERSALGDPRPAPLYVRAPDAAPSREQPPVILP